MLPKQFQNLIKHFSKFPGIGSRQATRFVFHLLRQPQTKFEDFINDLENLKSEVRICPNCFFIFDPFYSAQGKQVGASQICHICSDEKRNQHIICVVEKEADILVIEKTGHYNGVYHILGGNIYTIQENKSEDYTLSNLRNRLSKLISKSENAVELIFALNPTPDGDATVSFLTRNLKDLNIKTTRLARGLPRGADLEYADQDTLMHAIRNRS